MRELCAAAGGESATPLSLTELTVKSYKTSTFAVYRGGKDKKGLRNRQSEETPESFFIRPQFLDELMELCQRSTLL